jgi:hypothetical protein
MNKLKSLRAAIEAGVPELKREPDRLRMWIEDGRGRHTLSPSLSFGFGYRAHVLLVEMKTDLAVVSLAVFRWLRVNQPDLLTPGKDGFAFDADILDNGAADVLIQLDLTENVQVTARDGGGWNLDYLAEPDPLFADQLPLAGMDIAPPLTAVVADDA